MKPTRLPALLLATLLTTSAATAAFTEHLGLQLWSLRATTLSKGLPATLDAARAFGFTEVEVGLANPGFTPAKLRAELDARGLTAPSAHVSYEQLTKDLPAAVEAARVLGVKYAICPWIPHPQGYDAAINRQAAEDFNRAGAAFHAAGIRFGYHPHGYEFSPGSAPGDTLLDELIRATDAAHVAFQMDVFWVVHGGGQPVALLEKYPTRWVSLHVKDIRKHAPTGLTTGSAPDTDNVAVGTGQVDWPAVLRTARRVGVEYFFVEDETPAPLENIPASLAYLRALHL